MNLITRAESTLSRTCSISFEALMAPIDDMERAGKALRASSIVQAIQHARREDDASLPMGGWERELKRADWDAVIHLSTEALARKGKDLLVAAWLLEALVHRHGFSAIAGGIHLLIRLCDEYWDELHPRVWEDGYEPRTNIFLWINDKVTPSLRQVPLATGSNGQSYALHDWDQARRNEQLQALSHREAEGAGSAELSAALAATPGNDHLERERDLADALEMLAALSAMLERRMGDDAPSLDRFAAVLGQAHGLVAAELARRGVAPHPRTGADTPPSALPVAAAGSTSAPDAVEVASDTKPGTVIIRNRAEAYALLAQAISFLQQTEPHSAATSAEREAT